jgi:hypothetical protein
MENACQYSDVEMPVIRPMSSINSSGGRHVWRRLAVNMVTMFITRGCGKVGHQRLSVLRQSHFSILDPKWTDDNVSPMLCTNGLHFEIPGPHFLHSLESVSLEVSEEHFEYFAASTDMRGEEPFSLFFRFGEEKFEEFMDTFNFKLVDMRGRLVFKADSGFP